MARLTRAVAVALAAVVTGSLTHVAAHGELTSVHEAAEHLRSDLLGPTMLTAGHACVGLLVALVLTHDVRAFPLALPRPPATAPLAVPATPRTVPVLGRTRTLVELLVAAGVTGRGPPYAFC